MHINQQQMINIRLHIGNVSHTHSRLMIKVKHQHIRVIKRLTSVCYVQQQQTKAVGVKMCGRAANNPNNVQAVSTSSAGRELQSVNRPWASLLKQDKAVS
jgi:hypothetical protein